jgi:hypothetical protein
MRCQQSTIVVGLGFVHVFDKCKQMSILLTLENMTQVLLHVFLSFGIWMFKQMLVSFGINARSMFTSVCNGITTQIKHDMDPFFYVCPLCCT